LPGINAAATNQVYERYFKDKEIKTFEDFHINFERKTNPSAMITTGLAAPAAAMALKRTGQNIPAVKNFRLNLIPDVVFVPSCTLLALFGVRLLQLKSST
ncbi:hypothetical protein ACMD2_22334, partial [Ananas comosus]